jgi:hypothetical protein
MNSDTPPDNVVLSEWKRTSLALDQDYHKVLYEYLRHLSTLSTGAIVLVGLIIEKVFPQPIWRPLIVLSVASFLFSVVTTVTAYTLIVFNHPGQRRAPESWEKNVTAGAIALTWLSFLVGISALAIFILRNVSA